MIVVCLHNKFSVAEGCWFVTLREITWYISGKTHLFFKNVSQIMQNENTLSRSYLKVSVFIHKRHDNLWFYSSTVLTFIRLHTSTEERKLEPRDETQSNHFSRLLSQTNRFLMLTMIDNDHWQLLSSSCNCWRVFVIDQISYLSKDLILYAPAGGIRHLILIRYKNCWKIFACFMIGKYSGAGG